MEIKSGDEKMLGDFAAPVLASDSLMKLKTILVPTDFSDCSKQALDSAVPFARLFGARLELVFVVAPYYGFEPNGFDAYPAQETELARRVLNELARDVVVAGVGCKVQVRCGRVITEIVAAAHELSADLIIIATHGHTGWRRAAFGSIAEGVVRHAPCPVLTVRGKEGKASTGE